MQHTHNSSPVESQETQQQRTTLGEKSWLDYLWIIREHWILGLLVASALTGSYVYKQLQAIPLYKSSAILLFELQKDRVINIQEVVDSSPVRSDSFILKNHLTDLRSNTFRSRIVDSLSPEERELIIKDYRDPESDVEPNPHSIIAGANHINLVAGNIFNFEFHHRNPQAAELLANRFSEEFRDFLMERARKANESALRFLRSQSEELKLKVERSELAVQKYRQERNLVSLEESQNLIVERMKNLSTNLNEAKVQLLNLSASLERINEADGDLDVLSKLPTVNRMGTLPALFQQRSNLLAQRQTLSLRYGKRHPRMVENASALTTIEAEIREQLEQNVSDFREEYKTFQVQADTLENALKEAETEALNLDKIAIEYNVLRRKLETDTRLFTQVHQRLNEAILASQLSSTNMRVVDPAWAASVPFTPDKKKIYSVATFLFLLVFIGVPYALHFLNLKLKTASDVEQQLKISFLGEIRRFPKSLTDLDNVVFKQTDPQAAELFRQIHSQILLKNKSLKKGHTFVVTSALPKEGKSFFAINLAASFARHHYKTLLIDSDYRRPSIHSRLKEDLENLERAGPHEPYHLSGKFDVMPTHEQTVEATEWIESNDFRHHLQQYQRRYDIIIIDTPPAGLFPDAGMIGQNAHHFIFLTQLNKHRKAFLKGILKRLEESNASILGVVVNKVTPRKARNLGVYRYAEYGKYKNYYPSREKS